MYLCSTSCIWLYFPFLSSVLKSNVIKFHFISFQHINYTYFLRKYFWHCPRVANIHLKVQFELTPYSFMCMFKSLITEYKCALFHCASLNWAWASVFFLQIEISWPPCVQQVYGHNFLSSIYSLCVSVPHLHAKFYYIFYDYLWAVMLVPELYRVLLFAAYRISYILINDREEKLLLIRMSAVWETVDSVPT